MRRRYIRGKSANSATRARKAAIWSCATTDCADGAGVTAATSSMLTGSLAGSIQACQSSGDYATDAASVQDAQERPMLRNPRYNGAAMLELDADPNVADAQMRAVIFYLTTFGHIDGEFDLSEKMFVRTYIKRLVENRVAKGAGALAAVAQAELVAKYTAHFHEVFEAIDLQVADLFTEAVSHDEDSDKFVHSRLKLRCFEIFQQFDRTGQEQLMDTIDELLMADGEAHPAEIKFRAELAELLEADLRVELLDEGVPASATVQPAAVKESGAAVHPSSISSSTATRPTCA